VCNFIMRVMVLFSTACGALSVGAGTSTEAGSPMLLRRYAQPNIG
jgi:hypothetical protein